MYDVVGDIFIDLTVCQGEDVMVVVVVGGGGPKMQKLRVPSAENPELSKVQFSSVQSLDRLGRRWDMGDDDSAEILLQSFLQEALVSRSGLGRCVSIQHFLYRPRRRPPSKVP